MHNHIRVCTVQNYSKKVTALFKEERRYVSNVSRRYISKKVGMYWLKIKTVKTGERPNGTMEWDVDIWNRH